SGCSRVRSTSPTTVLSSLSETTTPSRIRFGIFVPLSDVPLLTQQRGDAGDVLAHFRDPVGLFHLAGGGLEAQVELFLLELQQLVGQLVGRLGPQIGDLGHAPTCSVWATPASRR